jgi:ankyrin repeat protein
MLELHDFLDDPGLAPHVDPLRISWLHSFIADRFDSTLLPSLPMRILPSDAHRSVLSDHPTIYAILYFYGYVNWLQRLTPDQHVPQLLDLNGRTIAHFASAGGNFTRLKEDHCDSVIILYLNVAYCQSVTRIQLCASWGRMDDLQCLLNYGVDPTIITNPPGESLVDIVAFHLRIDLLSFFLSLDIDWPSISPLAFLTLTSQKGDFSRVEAECMINELVSAKFSPTIVDEKGKDVLSLAARHNPEITWALLNRSDMEIAAGNRKSSLHVAASRGDIQMRERLFEGHVPIDLRKANGETPLMKAIRCSQYRAVRWLLEHGASADCENPKGQTAQLLATQEDDIRMIALFERQEVIDRRTWLSIRPEVG